MNRIHGSVLLFLYGFFIFIPLGQNTADIVYGRLAADLAEAGVAWIFMLIGIDRIAPAVPFFISYTDIIELEAADAAIERIILKLRIVAARAFSHAHGLRVIGNTIIIIHSRAPSCGDP